MSEELVALLRAQPEIAAPPRLRARVAAVSAAPPKRRPLPRRATIFALAAVLALAVFAAIVHGLVGGGSTKTSHALAKLPRLERAAVPPPLSAGAGGSVQGSPTYSGSAHASALAPHVNGGSRLQHIDASLRVRVANVDKLSQATTDATRIARSLGGYALSVQYRTPAGRPGQAFLELRIPTTKVQNAIAQLSDLGTIVSQQLFVQDLQRDLDRENAQIVQLREAVAAYQAALKSQSLTPVQRVELQVKLAETTRALQQRLHGRGATIAEGELSRVSLVLTTVKPVRPVTHRSSGVGRRLRSALSFLGLEATIALYALIVVSPFLVLGGLAWAAARARRRRDEERLLAA